MKTIGNIFLAWRSGKGNRRILVGVIKRNATIGTRFSYLPKGLKEAADYGFTCYEGFPDTKKEYTENVIEIFGQRITRSDRNDIGDFYRFWKIAPQYKHDNFYMLAYTQGLLPIDNFEFLADFNPVAGLSFVTELSGLSSINPAPDCISVGNTLSYQLDPSNPYDHHSVKVFKDDLLLGYVKKVHSRVFHKTQKTFSLTVRHIERNGMLKRVFFSVEL
ncbi:MAG: hypothetical protein QM786_12310 [Breznakibacter sp.]